MKAERGTPTKMSRVAVVAPSNRLRDALVAVADLGRIELAGMPPPPEGSELEALRRLERRFQGNGRSEPCLSPTPPDLAVLERDGRLDLLAGEVELMRRKRMAVSRGRFAALVGWTPERELEPMAARLAEAGSALVQLPVPRFVEPPTMTPQAGVVRLFRPLVETYGPPRYADVDPTPFAAVSFVVMFGMMFGDLGQGLLLALLGLGLRYVQGGRLLGLRPLWPFAVAAGLAAAAFGVLYGECFGPTGVIPTLWLDPLEEPISLLTAALAVGAVLLAASYALGIVNRWREEGALRALMAPSGIAGLLLFLGIGVAAAGWYRDSSELLVAGGAASAIAVLLLGAGFRAEAGRGAAAATEATIEVVDAVIRIVANLVSFTRLAAFGLMHAALGAVVFDAASALWGGLVGSILAAVVFILGNALTFSLEALVAAIQALRLEYYELFSRVYVGQGRRFAPWHIPLELAKEDS
jgi:V/A-type H+-transporting ATPase subunit I